MDCVIYSARKPLLVFINDVCNLWIKKKFLTKSPSRDLNTGPADYKSAALPAKPLGRHMNFTLFPKKGGVQSSSQSVSQFSCHVSSVVVSPFPDYHIFIQDLPDPMIRDTRYCFSRGNFHVISPKFLDPIAINT